MKRYAIAACGAERTKIDSLFGALHERGCEVHSCLLTSFGPGFAATLLVRGRKAAVLDAARSLKGRMLVNTAPADECGGEAPPANMQITVYGPARPETLSMLSDIIAAEDGQITEIESRTAGANAVVVVQALCPGRIGKVRGRLKALSRELGLSHLVERIDPEGPI